MSSFLLTYTVSVTDWAHRGVPGSLLLTNARQHVGRQWVVSLCIRHFFPSIIARQVQSAIDGRG